jgi:hypothetical protein
MDGNWIKDFRRFKSKLCQSNPGNWLGGRAPWSPFFNFLKFDILKFQKILDVYYDVFYSPAKFYNEIVHIPAYTKKDKF